MLAVRVVIQGMVQGVGFRPFLYRWAQKHGLVGTIQNCGGTVEAFLEGRPESIQDFLDGLRREAPEKAQIECITTTEESIQGRQTLEIVPSRDAAEKCENLTTAMDWATCPQCIREYFEPKNRRYLYPLISCTECGPRYTILQRLPYDRGNTAFHLFPPCPSCLSEYGTATNRRFHAQTIACQDCGPKLQVFDREGKLFHQTDVRSIEQEVHRRLRAGEILALKGLGGFQLVVDASQKRAVELLRERKKRPNQAFAIMARDLESVRKICELSPEDERLLTSPAAPILILQRRESKSCSAMGQWLSPDTKTLGVMLPTTPIHQLVFGVCFPKTFDFLVVTSGNQNGEPICLSHELALSDPSHPLARVADFYLTHGREIKRRCDDSVVLSTSRKGHHQIWRMGRGIAPKKWIQTDLSKSTILALGAELKNTISLSTDEGIIVSPHIGNLFQYETYLFFKQTVEQFCSLLQRKPQAVAIDLHPQYASSLYGKKLAEETQLPLIEIQHHHAHAVSCMLEHQLSEALALVYDGTGYGPDGTFWGGELLWVHPHGFRRLGRFCPIPISGGDSAILHPWKQACARFFEAGVDVLGAPELLENLGIRSSDVKVYGDILKRGIHTAQTSSVGRLFDSVSAMLGLIQQISYEGQPAILLERLAQSGGFLMGEKVLHYSYKLNRDSSGLLEVNLRSMIREISSELIKKTDPAKIACRFHQTIFAVSCDLIEFGVRETGVSKVVLSGGVFQNQLLAQKLMNHQWQGSKIEVFEHRDVPPNDGGISIGQAAIARHRFQ